MRIVLALGAGFALGLAHFAVAERTLHLWMGEQRALAAVLQVLRLLVTAAIFVAIARLGLWPLAAAFGGFLVARTLKLRGKLT
jgi:hypothetical protein